MTRAQFEVMNATLVNAVQLLSKNEITPFLSGSFAICAYARELVGNPQDTDFLFASREQQAAAVILLQNELGFTVEKQFTWESDTDDESINTKMASPEGVEFDLACAIGDIELSYDPNRTISIQGYAVPVLSLEDIKKSYQRFFDEKPGSAEKIQLVDELLKQV